MMKNDTERAATPLFEAIFRQAPDAMILADPEGTIRLWNPMAERVFGYAASRVLGKSLDIIIPERFREAHWRGFRNAIDAGTTKYAGRALTTRAVHEDGRTLYVDLTFALITDAPGVTLGVLAIARDCTESYLSQKARRAGAADLARKSAKE